MDLVLEILHQLLVAHVTVFVKQRGVDVADVAVTVRTQYGDQLVDFLLLPGRRKELDKFLYVVVVVVRRVDFVYLLLYERELVILLGYLLPLRVLLSFLESPLYLYYFCVGPYVLVDLLIVVLDDLLDTDVLLDYLLSQGNKYVFEWISQKVHLI